MNLETRLPPELWEAIQISYEKRNFTGAILDAFYFLSDLLRKKSGAEGDGAALIGQTLGGAAPKIKLNKLQSESEWNVQKGIEQLLRGFYQAIRNPRSHGKTMDTEEDAQILIIFIGYLIRQIDQAKAQFSRQDFLKRVLDPDFVPNERYAKLLVNEIPVGQRFEVFLNVYRSKESSTPRNLRLFFDELLAELTDEERKQVIDVLSEELKIVDDEATIRSIIGSFGPEIWPSIDESARLRIEHRLLRSIQEGRYDQKHQRLRGGALATWGTAFFPYFSLKQEVLDAVDNKLGSSSDEVDYVFRYLTSWLDSLSEQMPLNIERKFRNKLKAGDSRFHDALFFDVWDRETWTPALVKAYEEFKAVEPDDDPFTDDIPF